MEESKTLFDKVYEGGKEAFKAMKKPLVRKNVKRKIRAGWDDAQGNIDKAELDIQNKIQNISDLDLQACLALNAKIRNLKEAQEDLENIYYTLFGEKLDPTVE